MGEDEGGAGDAADLARAGGDVLQGPPWAGEQCEPADLRVAPSGLWIKFVIMEGMLVTAVFRIRRKTSEASSPNIVKGRASLAGAIMKKFSPKSIRRGVLSPSRVKS